MTLTFAAPWAGLAVPFDPHVLFDYLYAGFGIAATLLARLPLHRRAARLPLPGTFRRSLRRRARAPGRLVAVGSLALAFRALPERETTPRAYPKFSFPVKPLAVLCIYAFAYGLRSAQLPAGAGCTRRCRPPLSWARSSLSCTSSRTASR